MLTNQQQHDLAVKRQLLIERLKRTFVARADSLLQSKLTRMLAIARVEAGTLSFGDLSKAKLRKVLGEMSHTGGDDAIYESLIGDILAYVRAEEDVFDGLLKGGIEGSYVTPVAKTVSQLVKDEILAASNSALNLVVRCYTQHTSPEEFDALRESAKSEVRRSTTVRTSTLVQGVSASLTSQLLLSSFDEYVWISTIDSRTTDICRSRHLNVYHVGSGPMPPAHNFCRSCTAPYTRAGGLIEDHSFGDWLTFANVSSDSEFMSDGLISIGKYKELVGELWH